LPLFSAIPGKPVVEKVMRKSGWADRYMLHFSSINYVFPVTFFITIRKVRRMFVQD
jgi:hypothetical protein